jgi:probable rRNA maturation factor
MKIQIEIANDYKPWSQHKEIINKIYIKKIIKEILSRFNNLSEIKDVELSMLLTNNAQMHTLNNQFRGKDKATNVLSFPDIVLKSQHLLEFKPDINYMYLGDIAFGYEKISEEAKEQNKSLKDHFTHLLVHSILHLIGFDHKEEEETMQMQKLEIDILKQFSIQSPY